MAGTVKADRRPTPGQALMAVAAGHATWGAMAYRRELAEIGNAGWFDSVGDGIYQRRHSRDGRAAAFWFESIAPLLGLTGYLVHAAVRRGDARAVKVSAAAVGTMGIAGLTVMPRSGFPLTLPLTYWLLRTARDIDGR
jgi:hypothetical protein